MNNKRTFKVQLQVAKVLLKNKKGIFIIAQNIQMLKQKLPSANATTAETTFCEDIKMHSQQMQKRVQHTISNIEKCGQVICSHFFL